MRRIALLAYPALLAVLVGCSQLPQSASARPVTNTRLVASLGLPEGWRQAEALGEHLSIGCPPDWRVKNISGQALENELNRAAGNDARSKSAVQATLRLTRNNRIKIMLFHNEKQDADFTPTVVISALPVPDNATFDSIMVQAEEGMRQRYGKTKIENLEMPCGPTIKITVSRAALFNVKTPLRSVTFFVHDNDRIVGVNVTAPENRFDALDPEINAMMQTLRL